MCRLPWWRRSSVPAPGAGIPAASSSWAIGRRPSGGLAQRPRAAGPARRAVPWLGAVALDSAVMNVPAAMRARHLRLMTMRLAATRPLGRAVPFHQWTVGAPRRRWCAPPSAQTSPAPRLTPWPATCAARAARAEVLPQPLSHWRDQCPAGPGQRLHPRRGNLHGIAGRRGWPATRSDAKVVCY